MSTVILQTWDGITPDQYDQLRERVGWDRDVPAGMNYHVASFDNGTLRMTDVWDSEEQFMAFARGRIAPGLAGLGISGMPESIIVPAHDLFERSAPTA
jgi:hypothetical protein